MGEKCLWHFAREPSPGSYAAMAEVLGLQNVGEPRTALHETSQPIWLAFFMVVLFAARTEGRKHPVGV